MYEVTTKCEDCSYEKICKLKGEFKGIKPSNEALLSIPNFEVAVSCLNFSSKPMNRRALFNGPCQMEV